MVANLLRRLALKLEMVLVVVSFAAAWAYSSELLVCIGWLVVGVAWSTALVVGLARRPT